MKTKWICLIMMLTLLAVVYGHAADSSTGLPATLRDQLLHSSSFEAISLNPESVYSANQADTNANSLLGYPIVTRVKITDPALRSKLVKALSGDIHHRNNVWDNCVLEPHHGIRCINGTNTIVIVICYQCGDVLLNVNGKADDNYLIKTDGESSSSQLSKKFFNHLFHEAEIKTAGQ